MKKAIATLSIISTAIITAVIFTDFNSDVSDEISHSQQSETINTSEESIERQRIVTDEKNHKPAENSNTQDNLKNKTTNNQPNSEPMAASVDFKSTDTLLDKTIETPENDLQKKRPFSGVQKIAVSEINQEILHMEIPQSSGPYETYGDAIEALEQEPIDTNWSYDAANLLQTSIGEAIADKPLEIFSLDCRETMCQAQLHGGTEMAAAYQWAEISNNMKKNEWYPNYFSGLTSQIIQNDDGSIAILNLYLRKNQG